MKVVKYKTTDGDIFTTRTNNLDNTTRGLLESGAEILSIYNSNIILDSFYKLATRRSM